jgi:hypothetical protein
VMNALVTNRFRTMVGINDRAPRTQLITAHLLGLAYTRYVFKIEPFAFLPVEEIIALSVPVGQHYLADCPRSTCTGPTVRLRGRRCAPPAYG